MPAFVFVCHTLLILRHIFRHLLLVRVITDVIQTSFLGPSLLLFLCTCMFNILLVVSSPSFLNNWPYHLSRLFLRNVVIVWMLASLQMSSFLMWSFLFWNQAHHSILMSVVCGFYVSFPPPLKYVFIRCSAAFSYACAWRWFTEMKKEDWMGA